MVVKMHEKENHFGSIEVDDNLLIYADRYFKTVINNTKKNYLSKRNRNQKYGISFVSLERLEECGHPIYKGYTDNAYSVVELSGIQIQIHNFALASAIDELTEIQKAVLLRNIIFGETLEDISKEFNCSYPTIKRHKKRALDLIRKKLNNSYDEL